MIQSIRIRLIKFLIDLNESLFFERRLRNIYDTIYPNIKNAGCTIVDAGANKGQTIDFFLKTNPKCTIYAFEPNKTLFDGLAQKYAHNANIKLFNLGVSNHNGEKLFHQNILDYTSTFEDLNMQSSYLDNKSRILGVDKSQINTSSYLVKTINLSTFINTEIYNKNAISTIDVLKLDVEGHEFACLEGLFDQTLKLNIKTIQLEKHNDDMYLNKIPFEQILQLLNQNGFELKATIKHGFANLDEVIFENRNLHQ